MNYRHAYHAGNFADVVKHAVLCRVLIHLREKPTGFRVIDSHAGAGCYDLRGAEADKTKEWQDGIGRLQRGALPAPAATLLAPYLDAVAACNPDGTLKVYPGSPRFVQTLLRPQDRLTACELEPRAAAALDNMLRGDARAKAIRIDGWTALGAYVPPRERRGLVLIDAPFEQPGEFTRLAEVFADAHRKWPTGCYLLWYPIKDAAEVSAFIKLLRRSRIAKMLRVELVLANARNGLGLRGSGLIVVNPPWTLHDEVAIILPALATALGPGEPATVMLDWLARESAS